MLQGSEKKCFEYPRLNFDGKILRITAVNGPFLKLSNKEGVYKMSSGVDADLAQTLSEMFNFK